MKTENSFTLLMKNFLNIQWKVCAKVGASSVSFHFSMEMRTIFNDFIVKIHRTKQTVKHFDDENVRYTRNYI